MTSRHTKFAGHMAVAVALLAAGFTGCNTAKDPGPAFGSVSAAGATANLVGRVTVDGSTTVLPISRRMADEFRKASPQVDVAVQGSGTGGGFQKFCAGQVDIAGASRPINAAESQACQANHIEFIELPIGFEGLTVVVNARNTFVDCLTVAELKRMWEPSADGTVKRWSQIRSSFPDQPLALFGPGTDSGTFDYFTLAIVGAQSSSRRDYTHSEDDMVIVNGVGTDANALGYFGYSYYAANRDKLKLIAVDNGRGCVLPNAESVADNTYQPLSRPMFIYLSQAAAKRPEVQALARFYVDPANVRQVEEVGDVPLPTATLLATERRLDRRITGSLFNGRGSVLGLTVDSFQDEDRIKSALVQ